MISEKDVEILQEIVDESGDCLNARRCQVCPFRSTCLPEFLNKPITQNERLAKALAILAHYSLLGDEEISLVEDRYE
jgi:hypothetical protein